MCEHAIIKDNLSDYPLLKNLVPEDYVYHICSFECLGDNFKAHLKLKLSSEDEVLKWQEDFQASSRLTWRKAKTYPDVGRGSNKYRVDLRCQHNTRTNSKTSKNTCCPAFMYLILKRQTYSQGRKSRSEDAHIREGYYLTVVLNNTHNHQITCAAALAKRDVSKDTIGKLKKLFESGHSPASALDALKCDLQEQEGSNYWLVAADRSVCPDRYYCYRLYRKLFKEAYGAQPPQEEAAGCSTATAFLNEPHDSPQEEADECSGDTDDPNESPHPQEEADRCSEPSELENELASIFQDLTLKLRCDPSFRAPIASFVKSYKAIATDSGLQSALFTFTKSGVKAGYQRPRGFLQSTTQIPIQPTAVGRSKGHLGGKRSIPTKGRSTKRDDPYFRSGRKPAAPHNFSHCVETNSALGGTH